MELFYLTKFVSINGTLLNVRGDVAACSPRHSQLGWILFELLIEKLLFHKKCLMYVPPRELWSQDVLSYSGPSASLERYSVMFIKRKKQEDGTMRRQWGIGRNSFM